MALDGRFGFFGFLATFIRKSDRIIG